MSNMISGAPHNPIYLYYSETNPSSENKWSYLKSTSETTQIQPRHHLHFVAFACEAEQSRAEQVSLNTLILEICFQWRMHLANPPCIHVHVLLSGCFVAVWARRRTEAASSRWCSCERESKGRGRCHQAQFGPSTRGQGRTEPGRESGCRVDGDKQCAWSACAVPWTSFICMLSGAELIRGITADLN